MRQGTFQVGETVEGVMPSSLQDDEDDRTVPFITFRVAVSNHKYGHSTIQLIVMIRTYMILKEMTFQQHTHLRLPF